MGERESIDQVSPLCDMAAEIVHSFVLFDLVCMYVRTVAVVDICSSRVNDERLYAEDERVRNNLLELSCS
jgi:hypothetical protein